MKKILIVTQLQQDKANPTGSLSMKSVLTLSEGEGNTFNLKTIERVWDFQAPNEEAKNKWMKCLCAAVKAHRMSKAHQSGTKRERSASTRPTTSPHKVVNVNQRRSKTVKGGGGLARSTNYAHKKTVRSPPVREPQGGGGGGGEAQ